MSDLIDRSFLFYNMAWLPFERYELTTPLTPAQIQQKIAQADSVDDDYTVTQLNNAISVDTAARFKLGGYHQSFRPAATIHFEIIPGPNNLKVVLRPKLRAISVLILIVVILLSAICFTQRTNIALGRYKDAAVVCIGLLMLAYLLPVTAFNADHTQLKQFIADFFEVE